MSHGLVTLFKYPGCLAGAEAVTLLRYTLFAIMMASLLAGPAAAAPYTLKRQFDAGETSWSTDEVAVDFPNVGEYCPPQPYRIFCVGPYSPDTIRSPVDANLRIAQNDTFYNFTYDDERYLVHGPYSVPLPAGGDDLRICHFKCVMPYPFYVKVHANTTLDVEVHGQQALYREDNTTIVLGHDNGTPLPPPYGCASWQRWCE